MASCEELQTEYDNPATTEARKAEIRTEWENQGCIGSLDGFGDDNSGGHGGDLPPGGHN